MQPLFWLCGCPFSPKDIPGLPAFFVKQCDDHLSDEFLAYQACGEFTVRAQCTNIQVNQSLIPWICAADHDAVFGTDGEFDTFANKMNQNCSAMATLLNEVVSSENASLSQVRLLNGALHLLRKTPQSFGSVRVVVLQMRDQAMREYLGFWWYYRVLEKTRALP